VQKDDPMTIDPLSANGLFALSEVEMLRLNQTALTGLLQRRDAFFRSVLDSLPVGLLITNAQSKIIFVNEPLQEMTGYNHDELVGEVSYKMLLPPKEWPVMEARLQQRLEGKCEGYEHEIRRKDGTTHWVHVKAAPYYNAQGDIAGTIGALSCLERQKTLERENEYLRDKVGQPDICNIIGRSLSLAKVLEQIRMVAPTDATVLILGESGTGKELVAQAIHQQSKRRDKTLVRVNCASIPKELFESEFFGHVKGAFTGAIKDRIGRFELADGGTLFLDELGEIPPDLQSKLLRVLQEGQFEKLGEDRTRSVNVRVVAATNRDLRAEVKAGRFRQDLYYRLSVFPVELPPLRERREDVRQLAEHFLKDSAKRMGLPVPRLTRENLRDLEAYAWPGNVRELQNVIERAVILARGGDLRFHLDAVEPKSFSASTRAPIVARDGAATDGDSLDLTTLKQREVDMMAEALRRANGRIYGPGGAADLLGLRPTTLASRMKKLGLSSKS
jgi:PAS domain S-box-containing protein